MKQPHIAIIDSGLGGLSILREIKKKDFMPQVSYVADWENLPYGTKTEDEIESLISKLVGQVEKRLKPDLIVIACNTASTIGLELVRSNSNTLFVGVVPAIKPAAEAGQNFAVLATPATASGAYTQNLIDQFASHLTIEKISAPSLVIEAENLILEGKFNHATLHNLLNPILEQGISSLVLGCTHFPFLKDSIQSIFENKFICYDSGEAIARRVQFLLKENFAALEHNSEQLEVNFYYTGNKQVDSNLESKLNISGDFGKINMIKFPVS